MAFHPGTLPDLKGKVFIVTGGNSGIGYYTVAHLAEHGAHVYMCARSPEKGTAAIANIKEMHPSANIDLLQMDLMDLTSVVAAANHFLTLETALHGLANNAGIMATPFEMTKDGYEAQWQTNYLAHWVLTQHLLPLMLRTAKTLHPGSVRIVNLTSSGHLAAPKGGINFKDLSLKDNGPWARYGQSKLANILHAKVLHKAYGPGSPSAQNGEGEIWVSSVHPGLVETNLAASVGDSGSGMMCVFSVLRMFGLMWSADKGSWTSLFCAASHDMKAEQSGTYLEIFRRFGEPRWQSDMANDWKLIERLEEWTGEAMRKEGFTVVAAGLPHDDYGMTSANNVAFHLVMAFPRVKSYLGTQLEFLLGFGLSYNTFEVSSGCIDRTTLLKNSVSAGRSGDLTGSANFCVSLWYSPGRICRSLCHGRNPDEVLYRLQKLEEAVFHKPTEAAHLPTAYPANNLLEKLNATPTEAQAAFTVYTRLAISILDHPQPMEPSTTALVAMATLSHMAGNSDSYPYKLPLIRFRCFTMARAMQIHRLDTPKSHELRELNGYNPIELEVQRRIWWNMLASDWLNSFSGGPQEGAYFIQPKHMMVNYPTNTDDEFITPTGILQDRPLSQPSSLSAFIYRVKLATLCREVVDAMPSIWLEAQEPDYETILALDRKFQNFLSELPTFFKLDPDSIEKSKKICEERPYIPVQRISLHFSLHTRLCRLHRPYHLEGVTNPKYSYSHRACIQSAQRVLELRRLMDDAGARIGLKPGRFWTTNQHAFLAALILATDVSFNPDAPDAEARKAKVLAAYETLEKSKEESSILVETIQKNMQTLMSTLHRQRPRLRDLQSDITGIRKDTLVSANEAPQNNDNSRGLQNTSMPSHTANTVQSSATENPILVDDAAPYRNVPLEAGRQEEDWGQLWSDFLAVAPELDIPQWNSLLDDMDFNFGEST
ncbi:hypothetical protein BDV41DRAFT_561102 [Aspergillus transmontanensis]|uniref:Transcription factor domain-containing protein n=1 Tax=Aspergillus transmontanensis TaxID=1034304 RepID=A0A5N6WAP4_9EURO|nr:hypothetical protein BDV41DRAFT_561102 [Aspergillus transmontanensis]